MREAIQRCEISINKCARQVSIVKFRCCNRSDSSRLDDYGLSIEDAYDLISAVVTRSTVGYF